MAIDLHRVRSDQYETHERLLNWARWVRPGRGTTGMHPMFRLFRNRESTLNPSPMQDSVDGLDGLRIERIVVQLPETHRTALQWFYVFSFIPPGKVCRAMGVKTDTLHRLVEDGRLMVSNQLRGMIAGNSTPALHAVT